MSSGERPIGTAKGKQPNTEALCQPPPPPPLKRSPPRPPSYGHYRVPAVNWCQALRHGFVRGGCGPRPGTPSALESTEGWGAVHCSETTGRWPRGLLLMGPLCPGDVVGRSHTASSPAS